MDLGQHLVDVAREDVDAAGAADEGLELPLGARLHPRRALVSTARYRPRAHPRRSLVPVRAERIARPGAVATRTLMRST